MKKLHLFEEEITPKFLQEAKQIARNVFGDAPCRLVVHNIHNKVIYDEEFNNEKEVGEKISNDKIDRQKS